MESFRGSFPFRSLTTGTSLLRLVSVEPGSFSDPVQCKLRYVNLEERPTYEALSYVWGDATVTEPITLDGRRFPVTINLQLALRYLRQEDTKREFGIDAICINQTDMTERSEQVKRMHIIYKLAAKVIIWVGEDSNNSAFSGSMGAGEIFTQLARAARKDRQQEHEEESLERSQWTLSILGFISRPWFNRMWIIQESVANLETVITCGHASLPWVAFL